MEPDESFWRLVEPIWDKVSIYDGNNVFLREYAKISDKQKVLFSLSGHNQKSGTEDCASFSAIQPVSWPLKLCRASGCLA